jgi:hypothetical protein
LRIRHTVQQVTGAVEGALELGQIFREYSTVVELPFRVQETVTNKATPSPSITQRAQAEGRGERRTERANTAIWWYVLSTLVASEEEPCADYSELNRKWCVRRIGFWSAENCCNIMRLSADLLQQAEQRTNPLGDRELVLRGYGIRMVENLSVARDMFDTLDLSDNRITTLSNFPRMLRCHTLLLGDNLVDHIDATNVSRNVPSLMTLVLTNNRIEGLHEVANIGVACPNLENLILTGNPVCSKFIDSFPMNNVYESF